MATSTGSTPHCQYDLTLRSSTFPRPSAVIVRRASLETGEGKTGHIRTDVDEGLFFFGSTSRHVVKLRWVSNAHRCVPVALEMASPVALADGTFYWRGHAEGQSFELEI